MIYAIIDMIMKDGFPPIMLAAIMGRIDVIKILIDAGADVDKTNKVSDVAIITYYLMINLK
jgi:ankyrin repeat protein